MKPIFAVAFLGSTAFSCAPPAQAATCGLYEDGRARLEATYGEQPVWVGVIDRDSQLVIFGAADGSTYTVVQKRGDMACQLGQGTGWAAMEASPPPAGEDG